MQKLKIFGWAAATSFWFMVYDFAFRYETSDFIIFLGAFLALIVSVVMGSICFVGLMQKTAEVLFEVEDEDSDVKMAIQKYTLRTGMFFVVYLLLKYAIEGFNLSPILFMGLMSFLSVTLVFGLFSIIYKESSMKEACLDLFDTAQANIGNSLLFIILNYVLMVFLYFLVFTINDFVSMGGLPRILGIGLTFLIWTFVLNGWSYWGGKLYIRANAANGQAVTQIEEEDEYYGD